MSLDAKLHETCKLQDPSFMIFMLQLTFRIICFQNSASRCSGKHDFANRLRAFCFEKYAFLPPPPNRLHKSRFCHFCSPLSLHCSFGSLFFAPCPLQKVASGCSLVHFSPPRPFCKNNCMHHICNFVNFVCHLLFSFSFYRSLHPLLLIFGRCFENLLPALGGKHNFESCMHTKP